MMTMRTRGTMRTIRKVDSGDKEDNDNNANADIIFVNFFTPAQFQDFENLPPKNE